MKAKMPTQNISKATNYAGDKETLDGLSLVALYKGELREAVTVRCYTGRSQTASRVYASVWVYGTGNTYLSGSGQVGGYGYCKRSAAIAAAIRDAGIVLDESIAGCGMGAVRKAMTAIARAAGFRGKTIIAEH